MFFDITLLFWFNFSIEPEDLLVSEVLPKPCLSGSVKEDLISCVSKELCWTQKS